MIFVFLHKSIQKEDAFARLADSYDLLYLYASWIRYPGLKTMKSDHYLTIKRHMLLTIIPNKCRMVSTLTDYNLAKE